MVDVRVLVDGGVKSADLTDLPGYLDRDDALVWVDIPDGDPQATAVLSDVFCFHPLAVKDCLERNPVPKVHVYPDSVFVILHAPEPGAQGHVHYVELDQFVGRNFLITVHGPMNKAVDPDSAMRECRAVAKRLEAGRLKPGSPYELSFALVTALTGRLREYVSLLTKDVWQLEQTVTSGHVGDPEDFLEEMFAARHGLLTVRTMAALSSEVYGRMAMLSAFGIDGQMLLADMVDQFNRIRTIAEGQKDYLQGVIEFYQTRTNTKMTIAAERLAVIAAVTLPITALSSILGMNLIVNESTHYAQLFSALTLMVVMSALLLWWAKRKGWW